MFIFKALGNFLKEVGGLSLFIASVFRTWKETQQNFHPIMAQIHYVSFRSLPIVIFAGIFVGAILVIQFNLMLLEYDAQTLLGGINTSAVIREVGPLIISFLLAGKIGAYTAAELGTMRVTEQIDAIECLGTNSLQYLVLPRFVAIVFSSVVLLIIGMIVSVFGSLLVAEFMLGINWLKFLNSVPAFTSPWTLFSGVFRSFIYGLIVASVATYKGYTASGGARGVGQAVTQAAVYTNFFIILANYFCGQILDASEIIGQSILMELAGGSF